MCAAQRGQSSQRNGVRDHPVPLEGVVALAFVALLEVLLPPQPENAIATTTVATATSPAFIARSLLVRGLQDLPALGVAGTEPEACFRS